MSVPKAAVHEQGDPPRWEDDIRPAGKPAVVQSIAKAEFVQRAAHAQFGLGIGAPDTGHLGAPGWINGVSRRALRLHSQSRLAPHPRAAPRKAAPQDRLGGTPPTSPPE